MAEYDPDEFFSAEREKPPLLWTDEKIVASGFMTHSGPGGYEIHFRTPYRDKYLDVQRACRKAIDHGKPTTNADRIRQMSDAELADYHTKLQLRGDYGVNTEMTELCKKLWLDWLQQEVEDGVNAY